MAASTQLTLVLTLAGLVLFGAYGWYQVQTEDNDLRRTFEQETRLLGRSLQVGLENALRDAQITDVQETLEVLETIDPSVDIFVFDSRGELRAESRGGRPELLLRIPSLAAPRQTDVPLVHWETTTSPARLIMAWPLMSEHGGVQGRLVVARPLTQLEEDLHATTRSIIATVALFVLVTGVLGLGLGSLYIRRPLARIATAMRALRRERTAQVLPVRGASEIDAVAAEFNALVEDLRVTQARLGEQLESRRVLERGLRQVDKLATLGQLAAGLAHEIGSPLQILNGRARSLLANPGDTERAHRNAQILVRETDRIARIVEQLLSFARRRPAQMRPVDPTASVDKVVELLEGEARRHGVIIERTAGVPGVSVLADEAQVQQVVLNLLTNALAATPRGGRISIQLESSALTHLGTGALLPAVRMVVSDTGCGMPAETLDKIFQPFFTTRATEGGTGLGLAVVKAIINEHGGGISVASEAGTGTQFVIDWPVHGPAGAQAQAS